jgi:hypothetical protein
LTFTLQAIDIKTVKRYEDGRIAAMLTRIALDLKGAIFQFFSRMLFSTAHESFIQGFHFFGCCEVEGKLWQPWTLCSCLFPGCS